MTPKISYPARMLGALPVRLINAALGTELEPGPVFLSAMAHRHMAVDHPEDYPVCISALADAIASPSFIGQAPRRMGNFEIIKRTTNAEGKAVLVAIGLEPDETGAYRVRSCYLIPKGTVETRRQAGRLKIPLP